LWCAKLAWRTTKLRLATTYQNKRPELLVSDLPIVLDIQYHDIGDKQYRNQYHLRMAEYFILTDPGTSETTFECLFEATQDSLL